MSYELIMKKGFIASRPDWPTDKSEECVHMTRKDSVDRSDLDQTGHLPHLINISCVLYG